MEMHHLRTNDLYKVSTKYLKMGFTLYCLLEIEEKKQPHEFSEVEIDSFFKEMPFFFSMSNVEIFNDKIKLKEIFRDEGIRLNMPCYIPTETFKLAIKLLRVQSRLSNEKFQKNLNNLLSSIKKNDNKTKEKLLNLIKLYISINQS